MSETQESYTENFLPLWWQDIQAHHQKNHVHCHFLQSTHLHISIHCKAFFLHLHLLVAHLVLQECTLS